MIFTSTSTQPTITATNNSSLFSSKISISLKQVYTTPKYRLIKLAISLRHLLFNQAFPRANKVSLVDWTTCPNQIYVCSSWRTGGFQPPPSSPRWNYSIYTSIQVACLPAIFPDNTTDVSLIETRQHAVVQTLCFMSIKLLYRSCIPLYCVKDDS